MNAHSKLWQQRLDCPVYNVREAARYASVSPNTLRAWQTTDRQNKNAISSREKEKGLSYLQLIELAVVARMRQKGIKLKIIRNAREYLAAKFDSKYPFAENQFKTDGSNLLIESKDIDESDCEKLIQVSAGGQYAWREILKNLLSDFDYDASDLVVRWYLAGASNHVVVDPRISFGNPNVSGVPTYIIRERWKNGETVEEISEDFDLDENFVISALQFEDVKIKQKTHSQ